MAILACLVFVAASLSAQGRYQATGFKVGEVSATAAIVWGRLTLRPDRNPGDGPMVKIRYTNPEGEAPLRGRRKRVVHVDDPAGVAADADERERRGAPPGGEWASQGVEYHWQGCLAPRHSWVEREPATESLLGATSSSARVGDPTC